ncbi:MAG TPA: 50S ribosomal protein L11 methyltransferase [Candidatus Binatia bacterium]
MTSSWLQLSLRTDPSALDAVSNFLIERGSPGVVINKNQVQAYFACAEDTATIRRDVQRFLRGIRGMYPEIGEDQLRWRVLKDRNWNYSWRRFFSPQKVGQVFLVAPPWAKLPPLGRRHLIVIEPGMAFGTGTHATTRGCMEFIERIARSLGTEPFTALDVGTGSGILAIALAKVGASKVWALDNDPVALKVARENIACNGVEKIVSCSASPLNRLRTFGVVVANLTAETITALAEPLVKRVAPAGYLILSGILTPKSDQLVRHFDSRGFRLIKLKKEKEWATMLLKRK